jgi:uridine phosphorylase
VKPNHFLEISTEEGIIRPRRNKNDPPVGPDVILAFIKADLDYLISLCPGQKIHSYDQGFFRFHKSILDSGAGLIIAGPMVGAPQAVMAMEKLIALGGQRFWVIGWCGSLQAGLKIGDLIIPTSAVSEEGTSAHYPIRQTRPEADPELCDRLVNTLHSNRIAFQKGRVWTMDAPYRETPSKIKIFQQKGVLAVEMEMSALITLALFRKVSLAGLLVISDELAGLRWQPGFNTLALNKGSHLACQALMQTLVT